MKMYFSMKNQIRLILGLLLLCVSGLLVQGFQKNNFTESAEQVTDQYHQGLKVLNESIKEIEGIDRQKERLIARMEVIEELQQSRPEIVHLFDEITRNLPDGVTLNAITQQGRSIRLNGVAQSSTRVSSLMRNFDDSEWVDDPDLERIETIDGGQTRERFDFTLRATQVNPNAEEEGLQ